MKKISLPSRRNLAGRQTTVCKASHQCCKSNQNVQSRGCNKPKPEARNWISHSCSRGPSNWAILHYYPRCELHCKWSTWDSNQCSCRMPALQAATNLLNQLWNCLNTLIKFLINNTDCGHITSMSFLE